MNAISYASTLGNDEEAKRIDNKFKGKKDEMYARAIQRHGPIIGQFIQAMANWAAEHDLPLHAIKVAAGPIITPSGKLALQFIQDPEYDPFE